MLRQLVVNTPAAIYSFSFCISTGPGAPTKFSGRVLSDKEILITWKEPVNANGIIRSYYIRVYDTKSGQEAFDKIVTKEGNNGQSLLVSNLKPYTNFIFTIQAKTIEPGEMVYFTAKTLEGGTSVFVRQPMLPFSSLIDSKACLFMKVNILFFFTPFQDLRNLKKNNFFKNLLVEPRFLNKPACSRIKLLHQIVICEFSLFCSPR